MKQFILSIFFPFLSLAICEAQKNDTDKIIDAYKEYLVNTSTLSSEEVNEKLASTKSIKIDLNDKNQDDIKARIVVMLQNMRDLALAWSDSRSPISQDDSVLVVLNRSFQLCLDYFKKDPKWSLCQWELARNVGDITLLLRTDLEPSLLAKSMTFLKDHKLQGKGTGKDMTLINELGIHYGALQGDTIQIASCRNLIVKDISMNDTNGIQRDYSFHQGGKCLEMFNPYTKAFLTDHIRISFQLEDTPWKISRDKVNLLTDVVLHGWLLMSRGVYTVPGALGTFALRENALGSADLRQLVPFLIKLRPEKEKDFLQVGTLSNSKLSYGGMYYWPYSDFTAWHQPNFSFFIKTISTRTASAITSNQPNQKGKLLGTGDTYLMHDGLEYFNLMPVWNWQYLPGTTSFNRANLVERQTLTGNVNNGKSGVTAMHIVLKDSLQRQHLSVRKFWAMHDGMIVSQTRLSDGSFAGNAITTLDQCLWRGDVTLNKPGNVLKEGAYRLNDVSWIHHAGFVYIMIPIPNWNRPINLGLKKTSGSWKSLDSSQPDKKITENIFHLRIDEGHPVGEDLYSGYVIAHASTPQQAQAIAKDPLWEMRGNGKDCQAVAFKDGTFMAAFYTAEKLENRGNFYLSVSGPCLVLIEKNKLYVADMDFQKRNITINWNNRVFNVALPGNGATVEARQNSSE